MMTKSYFRVQFFFYIPLLLTSKASSELQEIQIGAKIEIYGAYYSAFFEQEEGALRFPPQWLYRRPIGPNETLSYIRADKGNSLSFLEQRTRIRCMAKFNREIEALVEFDTAATWGDNFSSDYLTGQEKKANPTVELYQSYISINNFLNLPIRIKIGRQELEFGSGWLVGADHGPDPFIGLSFDALRATYENKSITLDFWWAHLQEKFTAEEDGDIDFWGIYLTKSTLLQEAAYTAIDLYWMCTRDAISLSDTNFSAVYEFWEDLLQLDNYDASLLHTIGGRTTGAWKSLDWEFEIAYQFGEADAIGYLFGPINTLYGDCKAQFNTWAGHTEIGYSLNHHWQPRFYLGSAYYKGKDNRDITFWEWLNPLEKPKASISFNRLFSIWREDNFIDASEMSNFWKVYGGVEIQPYEKIEAGLEIMHFELVDTFRIPLTTKFGKWHIPVAPYFSFLTEKLDEDLGWQSLMWIKYHYAEDLQFELGWAHYFVGTAIKEGFAFADQNGTLNIGGTNNHPANYIYFYTTVEF